uniref:Transmembrane protein n=1 Tax=Podoviridae sp. ctP1X6 TaxID=2825246 RepID=A0A8S5U445_9CAUD|nr:MAG TPA: hypothetical protein [Podoviridae sp. ctP1X6]
MRVRTNLTTPRRWSFGVKMLVVFLNIFDLAVPIQVRKILYLYVFFRFLSLKRHLKTF